jgi:hypothetical protein
MNDRLRNENGKKGNHGKWKTRDISGRESNLEGEEKKIRNIDENNETT